MISLELFNYNLPPELIAQKPLKERDKARLLIINLKDDIIIHSHFYRLPEFLKPGDIIVVNKTKVIKARLLAQAKDTGGKLEIFFVNFVNDKDFKALVSSKKKAKPGRIFTVGEHELMALAQDEEKVTFKILSDIKVNELLELYGQVPLPHYIKRNPEKEDEEYYQTIFAEQGYSVAAPTAGLHFTERTIKDLREKGIKIVPINLNVGTGTFKPVKTEDITKHKMDEEFYEIPEDSANIIIEAKKRGQRIIACGTTTVRTLESWKFSEQKLRGNTDLFIYPGFKFEVIDGLITNFHLPKSTPLILVSAFAGREKVLKAYEEAIKKGYRFLSYGDAMLILPEIEKTSN
ncbi:MAG: tRNA preQ1(34) S-adenosylmethionine ribosyltransferase-isomerase QueA [bacterium]|nr:tRNA preQ1(34) S-adenosylmethionine ribosyltransferase-isomerase QueA [bacterium]